EPGHVLFEAVGLAGSLVALAQRREDLGEKARVPVDDLLIKAYGIGVPSLGLRDLRGDQSAPQCPRVVAVELLQVLACPRDVAGEPGLLGELAVVVRDARRSFAGVALELAIGFDGLVPLALALVYVDQLLERLLCERLARSELSEKRLRPIE